MVESEGEVMDAIDRQENCCYLHCHHPHCHPHCTPTATLSTTPTPTLTILNTPPPLHPDDDVRLARRIQRDVAERGRDVVGVIEQYTRFVKPAFDQFVAPSRRHADIIIPWARGDNYVAIDLIVQHIR